MTVLTPNEGRLLANAYGHFLPDATFRITDVRTPRPWANVMSNDRYGLVLSQAGAGFSWFDNCQIFRLTRWEQDLVQNTYGRFLYVQDLANPTDIRSTSYQPTRVAADLDEVDHGLGWTTFRRRQIGLLTEHTVFVPTDLDGELWIVRVTNEGDQPKQVRLTSYLEWHLGGVGDWHREFHRLFMETKVAGDALVAWKHPNLAEHRREPLEEPLRAVMAWKGADEAHWITDKLAFFGPEGSVSAPDALKGRDLPARSGTPRWDDPIGVGAVELRLEPGQTREIAFVLGAARGEADALRLAQGITVESAKQSLEATRQYWRTRCGQVSIPTEDEAEDLMVNAWLPYQAIAGRIYARCAYYQQGGAYGYRDQLQDSLMFLELGEPQNAALQLGRHAEAMYADGGVKHWWMPTEGWGPDSWHSDTCLWLMFGLLEYVRATGDTAFLDQEFSYLQREKDVPWVPVSSPATEARGTILEHALKGVRRALRLRSDRGLPLIGAGDWNDGLSHAGLDAKGESVWLAMFLFDVVNRGAALLQSIGRDTEAGEFEREAASLRTAVETHAWDGDWYLGGTRDDGKPFGSRSCEEGKIFLNPQTWAVLTGIASPERAQRAMASVREHLVADFGALLLRPAFSHVDPYIGYITRYAPGLRENGGVYSHASTWAILAFDQIGDRETARSLFRGMLPPLRSAIDPDLYAAEPYVMPGNADGPDSPYAGRAGWTWYTGSAAWMVRVAARLAR